MSVPKISVVLAVYNGGSFLREAIDSILVQSYSEFEFFIVNDGSTDKSYEIMTSYNDGRIKIINQKNTGLAIALNNAISQACGEFIARIDADDIAYPERLKLQLNFLRNNIDYVAVGGNADIIDKDGNYVYTSNQLLDWKSIKAELPKNPFFHSSTMYRKSAFDVVSGYPSVPVSQDIIFFNRLSRVGYLANLKEVLIKYRLSPGAVSVKHSIKESRMINRLILISIESSLSIKDQERLNDLSIIQDYETSNWLYHIILAKKYLWNNYQPKLTRQNLIDSFRIKISFQGMFLFLLSFLPKKIIATLYADAKKLSRSGII